MRLLTVVLVAPVAVAVLSAPVAAAQPADSPCTVAANFFCQFIPTAPDLEGVVDLTTQLPPVDPNAPLPETLPPVDPCMYGCI